MVTAIMIIEMMGRPAKHLEVSMKEHIDKLKKLKDIKLVRKEINKPVEIKERENQKELYSCFAEVEIECESLTTLSQIVVNFMPSSVEIVEPSKIILDCSESSELLSNVVRRLHDYDNIAKLAQSRINLLNKKLAVASKILYENGFIDKEGKLTKKSDKK